MRFRFDPEADAAYIYLTADPASGVVRTEACDVDCAQLSGINIDFDASGKLFGIEILSASRLLSTDFLAAADRA